MDFDKKYFKMKLCYGNDKAYSRTLPLLFWDKNDKVCRYFFIFSKIYKTYAKFYVMNFDKRYFKIIPVEKIGAIKDDTWSNSSLSIMKKKTASSTK